jgi:hypothetical protein
VAGYKFKHWEIGGSASGATTLIANNSNWKYFDGNDLPATNWSSTAYNDGSWKNGNAPLGYNSSNTGISTIISYGANASNKYTTAYFRKNINISNLSSKNNFAITTLADDGIVLYVNGTEVGRDNMPDGTISFTTVATTYNNGATASFIVPKELLVEGNNVIAAEVHQNSVSSSDLIFNLQMTCTESTNVQTETNETYSGMLTGGMSIKAIYEQSVFEDPDKNLSVFINEVVSSNNAIADEFGDKDDFIEIYNAGETDVNIAGWYISDIPSNPTAFQIPATEPVKTLIPAKNRLVLWADDEPAQGVLHLGFKLSKDGESLTLSKQNYLGAMFVVDQVSVPFLEQNLSYSRIPDGGETWKIVHPTYNLANIDFSSTDNHYASARLYPTLVSSHLTIENAVGQQIRIFDLTGKLLSQQFCANEKEVIELGSFQKGIYLISIGAENYKIIKL